MCHSPLSNTKSRLFPESWVLSLQTVFCALDCCLDVSGSLCLPFCHSFWLCADTQSIIASANTELLTVVFACFFFTVPNTLKKTDDFVTLNVPAVDLDHKFRCKVVDCLKFFRKAKLLHYHMKYFHGMEKSPEPEEGPGKAHVQTRGSTVPDKASQENLTRKRVSASSPSEYRGSVEWF